MVGHRQTYYEVGICSGGLPDNSNGDVALSRCAHCVFRNSIGRKLLSDVSINVACLTGPLWWVCCWGRDLNVDDGRDLKRGPWLLTAED